MSTNHTPPDDITVLLHRWQAGDLAAQAELYEILMPELRRMAARYLRKERSDHTLQATVLVNEAFLRLNAGKPIAWNDRRHFLAVTANIMRRYLIDYARGRPEARRLPLEACADGLASPWVDCDRVLAIDALLDQLETHSPLQRAVVDCKFFLGMTDTEAAAALEMPVRTLQREWSHARWWLFERLRQTD
jgi:RNA polymerase sigma factor (TIGR02999 family)